MQTQRQQEGAIHFDVDGVQFEMDVSGLEPAAQHHYRKAAASGEIQEPVVTRSLARLLRQAERPRFMDIGGFGGYYALYAAALLGEGSEPVHAIHQNPVYAAELRRSAELSGLHNLRVHQAVLTDVDEPAKAGAHGGAEASGGGEGGAGTPVTLDLLCRAESIPAPSVVRMNAHGSEGKVLFGMKSLLGSVDYLLMQLHNHMRLEERSPGIGRADILELFRELGLSVYYLAGHRVGAGPRHRKSVDAGRFAYRRVTRENAGWLFVDRLSDVLLLVTRRDDVAAVLGDSVDDPLLVY